MAQFNFTYAELCTAIDNWLLANCINVDYANMPSYFKNSYQYTKEFKASNPMAKGTKTVFTLSEGLPNGTNSGATYKWQKQTGETTTEMTFTTSYPTVYMLNSTTFANPKAKINVDPTVLLAEYAYIKDTKNDVKESLKRAIGFILSNCKYYSGFNSQEAFDATSQYLVFIKSTSATAYSKDIDISSNDFDTIFNKYVFPAMSSEASILAQYTSQSFPLL